MSAGERDDVSPWEWLGARMAQEAEAAAVRGDDASAVTLRELAQEWRNVQQELDARMTDLVGAHHEINNALVGIRGNAQLLLMNPAGQLPGIRERLEVVLRESGRIQEAAGRLRDCKPGGGGPSCAFRAA